MILSSVFGFRGSGFGSRVSSLEFLAGFGFRVFRSWVLDLGSRVWASDKNIFSTECAVVPRRARIEGSKTFVPLNSRLDSNKEEEVMGLRLLRLEASVWIQSVRMLL